mmetsp:Transcript_39108/g.70115  ORF Transcript_39108/g.70115 Transcript_39108/m.70115 type:complete len:254 (+) Transcript_39108:225-986(+)
MTQGTILTQTRTLMQTVASMMTQSRRSKRNRRVRPWGWTRIALRRSRSPAVAQCTARGYARTVATAGTREGWWMWILRVLMRLRPTRTPPDQQQPTPQVLPGLSSAVSRCLQGHVRMDNLRPPPPRPQNCLALWLGGAILVQVPRMSLQTWRMGTQTMQPTQTSAGTQRICLHQSFQDLMWLLLTSVGTPILPLSPPLQPTLNHLQLLKVNQGAGNPAFCSAWHPVSPFLRCAKGTMPIPENSAQHLWMRPRT